MNIETVSVINELCTQIYTDNEAKGFWESCEYIPKWMKKQELIGCSKSDVKAVEKAFNAQKLALIHSEISEAMEADRKDLMDDKLLHRKGLEVELADAFIRICDMAGGLNMDLGGAIIEKLEYNRNRPHKHGKNY
jgi:NTP pyrophosphatase (non-canonical NTP hydrolase)